MKTPTLLLRVGAAANALFFLFHLWLGWQLHQLTKLDPAIRSLLEMLNGGGAVCLLFLVFASWAVARELETAARPTHLGRIVVLCALVLYAVRAAAEIMIAPRFNPVVFATCIATALLYAGALLVSHWNRLRIARGQTAL
ncbi:MAG TPA: hypothetical protein VHE61_16615 [Opitutaceae bacterium]|nr:hypothetical protein [Opitutaceae bacterium]